MWYQFIFLSKGNKESTDFKNKKGTVDESQTGITIAGRNTNNLRYADDTTLMAESKQDEGEKEE